MPGFFTLNLVLIGSSGLWLATPMSEALTFVIIVVYYLGMKKSKHPE